MKAKADFQWKLDRDRGFLAIVDLDLGRCSVTNDAENVLCEIESVEGSLEGIRIMYRDSTGLWDQLKWNGQTVSFAPLHEATPELALKRLLAT